MPAQSSLSIGFLILVGSRLTLCGIMCNNNAMLSPSLLRYDPSKSNFRLLVTIVASVFFAFLQKNMFLPSSPPPRLETEPRDTYVKGTAPRPHLP